jgi:hypothetical protein
LESTARRTVLAQSLLDISDTKHCKLVKLCEITYHRPKEELRGKSYPEQDEVTVIYLCTVHTLPDFDSTISVEEFDRKWELFLHRSSGSKVGPIADLEDVDAEISSYNLEVEAQASLTVAAVAEEGAEMKVDLEDNSTSGVPTIEPAAVESAMGVATDQQEYDVEDAEDGGVDGVLQYYVDNAGYILVDEESALGLIITIIQSTGVDEDDAKKAKSMARDKILREIKSQKGEAWTTLYKPTCGSLPEFLAAHGSLFLIDGTKVVLKGDASSKLKVLSSTGYESAIKISSNVEETNQAEAEDQNHDKNSKSIAPLSPLGKDSSKMKPTVPCVLLCPQVCNRCEPC